MNINWDIFDRVLQIFLIVTPYIILLLHFGLRNIRDWIGIRKMKTLINKKEAGDYIRKRRWEYQARDLYYNNKQRELINGIKEIKGEIMNIGRNIVSTLHEFENCSHIKKMDKIIKNMVDKKEKSKKS